MGNSNSKEKENEAALNSVIDSYNDNSLVKFHRFLSGDDKISHLSTFSQQNTNTNPLRDLGLVGGGYGAANLVASLTVDNSNTYIYEFHNHGTGTQEINLFKPF